MEDWIAKSAIRLRKQLVTELQEEVGNLKSTITQKLSKNSSDISKSEYFENGELKATDPISVRLFEVFGDNIGANFKTEELMKIFEEGESRYLVNFPPGFRDLTKQDYRKFGDLIIWKELIRKSKETSKPIIFITDDVKSDWWEKDYKSVRPHPELFEEFYRESGQYVQIFTYEQFVEQVNQLIEDVPETSKVIEEIKSINEDIIDLRPLEIPTPQIGDVYYYDYWENASTYGEREVIGDKLLLYKELENNYFLAFPLSKLNSKTIKLPQIVVGGMHFAVRVDKRCGVRGEYLKVCIDRINLGLLDELIELIP
ncbi:hypothetical protein D3P08_03780 [Paenibacillus nanensis]|uniref:PIN like domain-containing protein n=1 Tax=Paenibacillus nanensis TaxID=393251 RepID=A0A3A1VGA3_9BACL|nr:PIN-like domain-containing protein [Paenibacillus nanensis]RIX59285.1 hypothetical protein D3P08_03780 [Paenibacillus nanensis]